jgi:UDP-GlcNAc:undecaprenyl-phosphate GlcNAc-1-phosphate transferase
MMALLSLPLADDGGSLSLLSLLSVLFFCPLAIAWLLTAGLVRWSHRLGLIDYPAERKVHTTPTPRSGGLAIWAAVLLTAVLLTLVYPRVSLFTLEILLASLVALLGLLDDLRPQPWQLRLGAHAVLAAAAVFLCLPPCGLLERAAAWLWIVALLNAFNMLDNMDMLSGGVAWIAAGFLALALLLGCQAGPAEWAIYPVLMGALSGFLWFNRSPARIFMGDCGSTFLGFLVGLGSARLALRPGGPSWQWGAALAICAVPCYDLLTVVALRLSQGRSPFHADKQHLSHRLVCLGLSKPMAVGAIHLAALASGASGLLVYAVDSGPAAALVGLQLAAWWAALAIISESGGWRVEGEGNKLPSTLHPPPSTLHPEESSHDRQ